MAHLTDEEINRISVIWKIADLKMFGSESLSRLLLLYPTIKGQFAHLGDIRSYDAILHNPKVKDLGEKIMGSVGAALRNINNLDTKLTKQEFEKLNMDQANFKLFEEMMTIVLARNLPAEFTPEVHAAFKKAFTAMSAALSNNTTE